MERIHSIRMMCRIAMAMCWATLMACASTPAPSTGHLGIEDNSNRPKSVQSIPAPVIAAPVLPRPVVKEKPETYTVTVNEVPIKELLFALARDAKLNLDIYDDISGMITLNAIDQTLPQILDRIGNQSSIRYTIKDNALIVSADRPYLHTYKVEYVNISREGKGEVSLSTQIATTGSADVAGGKSAAGDNKTLLNVTNISEHHFWKTLSANIGHFITNDDPLVQSANNENKDVIVNREAGYITVRATGKQHDAIQKYIDTIVDSAKRQVLIEATVVEVILNNSFQSGVNWERLVGAVRPDGLSYVQNLAPTLSGNMSGLIYGKSGSARGDISADVKLLEEFGNTRVLSSPKIMTLNNQTAVLKVVNNLVYFTLEVSTTSTQGVSDRTQETTIHTVPVGLVMSLTPYIDETDEIMLNIRPSISRVSSYIADPNPAFKTVNISSLIPQVQVQEMESILKLSSGQITIIGGLMQDDNSNSTSGVPYLSRVPGIGEPFKQRDNKSKKSELIIFLRASVIRSPSVDGDLQHLKSFLPAQ